MKNVREFFFRYHQFRSLHSNEQKRISKREWKKANKPLRMCISLICFECEHLCSNYKNRNLFAQSNWNGKAYTQFHVCIMDMYCVFRITGFSFDTFFPRFDSNFFFHGCIFLSYLPFPICIDRNRKYMWCMQESIKKYNVAISSIMFNVESTLNALGNLQLCVKQK